MRFLKKYAPRLFLVGALLGLLAWPATTRQGVDYHVTEKRLPLIIKGMDFLVRDYEYRRLADEVTRGLGTDESKAEALFQWTREHIRPTPLGWPVVDDHISHIIIRGYGESDQMADVFTTLATYAGIPSFWRTVRDASGRQIGLFCFVKIDGRWTVWNVAKGIVFRDNENRLISVEELARNSPWERLAGFTVPEPLRAQAQMPWPRLRSEIRRGWAHIGRKSAMLQ